jgi:hypothetical protein
MSNTPQNRFGWSKDTHATENGAVYGNTKFNTPGGCFFCCRKQSQSLSLQSPLLGLFALAP